MSTVPIQEIPIPEARDDEQTMLHTLALLQHDIPGFVIRHEVEVAISPEEAQAIHARNRTRVQKIVAGLHPDKLVDLENIHSFSGLGQDTVGTFHNDIEEDARNTGSSEVTTKTEPLVHTTLSGGGSVILAAVGSSPDKVLDASQFGPRSKKLKEDPDSPHNQLLQGKVDPQLVSPKVYKGEVEAGDTLVVAGGNSRFASWHRMDTDQAKGERKVAVSKVIDITNSYSHRAVKGDYIGFDLPNGS